MQKETKNKKKKSVQTIRMNDSKFTIYFQDGLVNYQGLINLLTEALNNVLEDSLPTFMLNFGLLLKVKINYLLENDGFKHILN